MALGERDREACGLWTSRSTLSASSSNEATLLSRGRRPWFFECTGACGIEATPREKPWGRRICAKAPTPMRAHHVKTPAPVALPNPVSRPEAQVPGEVTHRNLYCALYSECLQFAARKGWKDWSCESCALNLGAKPPGAAQWAEARIRRD
jgi:hypothetical protein